MIVEALKAWILKGSKLKAGDSEALLTLSDKIESCCYAIMELNWWELYCTTNLKQIYDHLPAVHLRARWLKSAIMFGGKTGDRELTLKVLSYFICTESLTENIPVYRRETTVSQ